MKTKLVISYTSDYDTVDLHFAIRDHGPAQSWATKVLLAQQLSYPIDDPGRFYGFGELAEQEQHALASINECIDTINSAEKIISHRLNSIHDQDHLNYLHHIFEVYHGLLDQQNHKFWLSAPSHVRQALADLNILVHRCETVARGAKPRHVVTYFGLPKVDLLDYNDYQYFTDTVEFGTVYLNYVEIGKTLENLAEDNDRYISDEAFQPFRRYSADFNVQFWQSCARQTRDKHVKIKQYYDQHTQWFLDRQLPWGHPYLRPGMLPVADLVSDPDRILEVLTNRQWVASVSIT